MSYDEKCRDLSKKLAEANFLFHQIWAMKKQEAKELPSKSSMIPAGSKGPFMNTHHMEWSKSLRNPF
jgi:hypothetical protein